MTLKLLSGAALLLALCGCNAAADETSLESKPDAKATAYKEVDPEAKDLSVSATISTIPLAQRVAFQKLFACEVRRNNLAKKPRPVDADFIRAIANHMKKHPNAGANCNV